MILSREGATSENELRRVCHVSLNSFHVSRKKCLGFNVLLNKSNPIQRDQFCLLQSHGHQNLGFVFCLDLWDQLCFLPSVRPTMEFRDIEWLESIRRSSVWSSSSVVLASVLFVRNVSSYWSLAIITLLNSTVFLCKAVYLHYIKVSILSLNIILSSSQNLIKIIFSSFRLVFIKL